MLADILNDTMHEVWPRENAARHAYMQVVPEITRPSYELYAWRWQGDIVRYSRVDLPANELVAGEVGATMDRGITEALALLKPLTTSEALEAGERRRGQG
jgi:hypothetical protein